MVILIVCYVTHITVIGIQFCHVINNSQIIRFTENNKRNSWQNDTIS